jgi:hypothetical protein
MRKIWVNKTESFKAAAKFEEEYYLNMSSSKRLELMQFLREAYFKFKRAKKGENRKGLRRHIRIIQQT